MYINTVTNQYPVSEQDIRSANPNIGFPYPFVPLEQYSHVFPVPQPTYDALTQTVRETAPELTNLGHWEQRWEVVSRFVEYTDAQDVVHTVAEQAAEVTAIALAAAKADKTLQINQWRATANQTYFTHSGKQIACDALSRSDIDAVAGNISLNGTFPTGFPGAWKALDNSYILLADVDAFKAMYTSMTNQGTINFGQSQTLKATLAAATTVAEVNAIAWS